jgi:hypothetical protein
MNELACTLTPADMSRRGDEIRAVGRDGLLSASRDAGAIVLRFRPAVRERVEAIVEAESRCCAFLDFTLVHEGDELVLEVRAPDGAEAAVEMLAELFAGDAGRAA